MYSGHYFNAFIDIDDLKKKTCVAGHPVETKFHPSLDSWRCLQLDRATEFNTKSRYINDCMGAHSVH